MLSARRTLTGLFRTTQARRFTSSRLVHGQFLVIAQDIQEPETLERRADTRPAHIEGMEDAIEDGLLLWGGAMLNEDKPVGSALVLQADTVEEVRALLKRDPYLQERVWDPAKIQIIPVRTALAAFERNLK